MGKYRGKGSKTNRYINPGINDYRPARSNNVVTPSTIVWFGKHKGLRASEVPKSYWRWARENLTGLAISPDL